MDVLLEKLCLASFGYTFNRSLTWGQGGPENWPSTQPYATPEGQEDQLGFNNYEWLQAIVERTTGKRPTVLIMDAGNPAVDISLAGADTSLERLQLIVEACHGSESDVETSLPVFDSSILACTFDLDTLSMLLGGNLSVACPKKASLGSITGTLWHLRINPPSKVNPLLIISCSPLVRPVCRMWS